MLNPRVVRQVLSVAVLPAVFMLPIVLILMFRISAVRDSEVREERMDSVISETHIVHEQLISMESALRGYLLTGDPTFLTTFAKGRALIATALASTEREAQTDAVIRARVARLATNFADWLATSERAVGQRRRVTPSEVKRVSFADKAKMDAIESDVARILAGQSDRRDVVISGAEQSIRHIIIIAIICALLAAIATGYAVRRAIVLTRIEQEAEQERIRREDARRRTQQLEQENIRIQTADRLKGEYVANMSHELRTPLTAMLGFSEVLRDQKPGPINAEQAEYLDYILKSGRHLLDLIGTVLDLAKVEAGKLEVSKIVVDPRELVSDVTDGMRNLAARKSISLEVDFKRSPLRALVDPLRFRQILYNYLSNAIKFTPNGGRVSVRLTPEGRSGFRLAVEDNGLGLSPGDLQSLFKEYRQIDRRPGQRNGGTGLGLALTKRVVEAQGGTVEATSIEGRGSTFCAVFPDRDVAAPDLPELFELRRG